jgi:hypothetical protein
MTIILLTTTVNVQNKRFLREVDPVDRMNSYNKSISQWLTKTNLPIVVVENTGYTFPEWEEKNTKIDLKLYLFERMN